WHWALGADGGHGHAQPPFRSSRLIGAERQPTSDCRQSLQQSLDDGLLQYLSPLGWEHINLTGDYLWRSSAKIGAGKFRPLRPLQAA
ncbi:Tn3 family transposase, partial [Aeromonas veronii]|uniref:Tn3 family transposase n=1 Tax=Aeromonas veronii TaxID=654 RepID=UPI001F39B4D0